MLASLLVLGVVLRVFVMVTYWPAFLSPDSGDYLFASERGLFTSPEHPAGYPAFLRLARDLSSAFPFTVALQHVLGIATAILLYAAVRRASGVPWLGLVPAAVVLLTGDQIFFEHAVLAESLFAFLLAAGLYAGARSLDAEGVGWLAAAGALLGLATTVRTVAIFLIPALCLWALQALPRGWRGRLLSVAVAGGAAATVLLGYALLQESRTGYFGLARTSGWSLYARVAQFADCREFEPPAGTRRLCERTPPDARPGPAFYHWDRRSPAWAAFGRPPNDNGKLGSFARAAIVNQPTEYARAVGTDMWRYVDRDAARVRPRSGTGPTGLVFERRSPLYRQPAERYVDTFYEPVDIRVRALGVLRGYQNVVRVHGPLVLALALLVIFGTVAARGRARSGILLFGGFALVVIAMSPATLIYNWRYAVPALAPLAAGAALAAWSLARRGDRHMRSRRASGPDPVL